MIFLSVHALMHKTNADLHWQTFFTLGSDSTPSIWPVFYYYFGHIEVGHLVLNALIFCLLAPYLENYHSPGNMTLTFLGSAIAGGVLFLVNNTISIFPQVGTTVGASGGIAGLAGAYLIASVPTTFSIGVRVLKYLLKLLIIVWIGGDALGLFTGRIDGTAYITHVAGFLTGMGIFYWYTKTYGSGERLGTTISRST